MQQYEGGSPANATAESVPPDELMREQMQKALHEAAERVTFHRVELERWERLGRAASEALTRLNSAAPVEQQSPEMFGGFDKADPSPSYR